METSRGHVRLVQPARLELALLDPQLRRHLVIVAAHLLDEPLGVLEADERLDRVAEREVAPERTEAPSRLPRRVKRVPPLRKPGGGCYLYATLTPYWACAGV